MAILGVRVQFVVILMAFRMLKTSVASGCSFYTLHGKAKSWKEGRRECRANGGDLLSMETEEEYQFINKTIQSRNIGKNEWTIGLTKKTGTEFWKWVSGQALTIDKWQPRQPSGDRYGDCVIMAKNWPPGHRGKFNDLSCYIHKMFICEYKNEVNHTQGVLRFCPFGSPTKTATLTPSSGTTIKTTIFDKLTSLSMSTSDLPATLKPLTTSRNTSILSPDPQALRTSSPGNAAEGFPTMLVAIIVLGILLAVGICIFFVVFWWLKRKSGGKKKEPWQSYAVSAPVAENRAYLTNQRNSAPDQAETEDIQLYSVPTEPDVLYAEIADDFYLEPCDSFDSPAHSSTHSEVEYANSPNPTTTPSGYEDLIQNPVYQNHMPYQPLNKCPDDEEEDEIAI